MASSSQLPPVLRSQLLRLYRRTLKSSTAFPAYNFRSYFVRRTKHIYRNLPGELFAPSSSQSSFFSTSAATTSSAVSTSPAGNLQAQRGGGLSQEQEEVLKTLREELRVLQRQSIIHGLYEAPKLVVEGRGRAMAVGGGGAGAEASAGGAGQPINPSNPQSTT